MVDEGQKKPKGAGKSSFELVDTRKVFDSLPLRPGACMLDLGCGRGEYTLEASPIVGQQGCVVAIDLWEEGIVWLRETASVRRITNIKAVVDDVSKGLPMEDASVDVCFMGTMLHDLVEGKLHAGTMEEVSRVLKPQGILAVLEFVKMEGPPGPPISIRLSPDEVGKIVSPYGFRKTQFIGVGPYNYLITFGHQERYVP